MTKERLRNYRNIKREAAQLDARVRELSEALYSPRTARLTGMPSGSHGFGSEVEAAAARLLDLEEMYRATLAELSAEALEIERAIEALPESVDRQLMRARYLDGLKWEEVCVVIGYSWQQTHRIHARALAAISA